MAAYVGDAVALLAEVTDPFTKAPLADYTVHGDVYYGNGDPKRNPAIREAPQVADIVFTWSEPHQGYLGYVETDGFPAGTIYVRLRVTGPVFNNVEFGSFKLTA